MGHNACVEFHFGYELYICSWLFDNRASFLRWKAIQDAVFVDPADGKEKIWSESNVSEDFDMALRLILKGYIVRSVFSSFFCLPVSSILISETS